MNAPATLTQQRTTLRDYLSKMQTQLAEVLPRQLTAERMMKCAMIAANENPDLYACSLPSIAQSLMRAASMGLEPVNGQCYLVPFNVNVGTRDNPRWEKQCQLVPGYRGLIQAARNSGSVKTVAAHVVYANDTFSISYGTQEHVEHKPLLFGDRGAMVAVYAVATFTDGAQQVEVMTADDVEHVKQKSQTGKRGFGPWETDTAQMWRKSAVKRLANYLPLSAEARDLFEMDSRVEGGRELVDVGAPAHVQDALAPEPAAPQTKTEAVAAILAEPDPQAPTTF